VRKAGALAEAAMVDSPNHPSQFDYAEHLMLAADVGVAPPGESDPMMGLMRAAALLGSLATAEPQIVKYRRELATAEQAIGNWKLGLNAPAEAATAYGQALLQAQWVLQRLP